jgi:nucleotidyltransferase substrate binding protein (TIGR01987 family)
VDPVRSRLESARRALGTLQEILAEPKSVIIRDASIQRFEYSFESVWKALKAYLLEFEGVDVHSPKSSFRGGFRSGLISAEDTRACLRMTDDRNLTAHTYIEPIAEDIYRRLAEHCALMLRLLHALTAAAEGGEGTQD